MFSPFSGREKIQQCLYLTKKMKVGFFHFWNVNILQLATAKVSFQHFLNLYIQAKWPMPGNRFGFDKPAFSREEPFCQKIPKQLWWEVGPILTFPFHSASSLDSLLQRAELRRIVEFRIYPWGFTSTCTARERKKKRRQQECFAFPYSSPIHLIAFMRFTNIHSLNAPQQTGEGSLFLLYTHENKDPESGSKSSEASWSVADPGRTPWHSWPLLILADCHETENPTHCETQMKAKLSAFPRRISKKVF